MFSWDADTKKQEIDAGDIGNSLIDQIPSKMEQQKIATIANPSQTLILPDLNIGPTLILPQNDEDDITQKLQNSDRQQEMPQTLIQKQQQSQKKQRNNNSFQLPKTLVQDQMPATLQDSQSKNKQSKLTTRTITSVHRSNQPQPNQKIQKRVQKQPEVEITSKTFPQNMNKSTSSNIRKSESYQELLFGLLPTKNNNTINNKDLQEQQQQPNSLVRSGKPLINPSIIHQKSYKQQQIKQQTDKTIKEKKRVIFTGFKLTNDQRNRLIKLNMKIIENSEEDYDVLIISRQAPKITKRLLEALIKDKQIINDGVLINGNGEITQNFLGMGWKDIINKHNRNKLYKDKKVFLSQILHTYKQIIELAGGIVIDSLLKTKGHIMMFLSPDDFDIYKNYKNNKTKTFYSQTILQKSILSNILPEQQIQQNFFTS